MKTLRNTPTCFHELKLFTFFIFIFFFKLYLTTKASHVLITCIPTLTINLAKKLTNANYMDCNPNRMGLNLSSLTLVAGLVSMSATICSV